MLWSAKTFNADLKLRLSKLLFRIPIFLLTSTTSEQYKLNLVEGNLYFTDPVPMMINNSKGFTLIELLAVLTIVGVLGAISISAFSIYKGKAFVATIDSGIRACMNDIESYVITPGATLNRSAGRQNLAGTVTNQGLYDRMLPTARAGENVWIWVRAQSCPDPTQDYYYVWVSHRRATERKIFYNLCSGAQTTVVQGKAAGVW